MKKALLCILLFPLWAFSYSSEDIDTIELDMNHDLHAYNIVFMMNDGNALVSNLTASGEREDKTYNRLHNVTKNTPGFEEITYGEVQELFDWNRFDGERNLIKELISVIIEHLEQQEDVDAITLLDLYVTRATY